MVFGRARWPTNQTEPDCPRSLSGSVAKPYVNGARKDVSLPKSCSRQPTQPMFSPRSEGIARESHMSRNISLPVRVIGRRARRSSTQALLTARRVVRLAGYRTRRPSDDWQLTSDWQRAPSTACLTPACVPGPIVEWLTRSSLGSTHTICTL